MRVLLVVVLCSASVALADDQIFHGWSKDGTWLVYEEHGENDVVELYFCQTDAEVKPSWPKVLNEETLEEGPLSCVRFIDPNKAPYQWKKKLVRPGPSMKSRGLIVQPELVVDGEEPGFVLAAAGDKKQVCYASGLREDSKLQKVWFHPNGRWAAAQIDGHLSYCAITVKPGRGRRR